MDNLPDANSALIDYIGSLLMDGSASGIERRPDREALAIPAKTDTRRTVDTRLLRVLFFKVAAVPLAISLEDISGVIDGEETAPLYESSGEDGVVGVFGYRGRDIDILDTRELILPDGHPGRSNSRQRADNHIIILAEYDVGLLCDEVGNIVDLQHQEVEWRTQRHSRTWLAGMVRGYAHALLDIRQLLPGRRPNDL